MACIVTQHRLPNQHLAIVNQNFIPARHYAYRQRFQQQEPQLRPKMRILALYCVRKFCQLSRRQGRLGNLLFQEDKSCEDDPDASEPDSLKTDPQHRRQMDISFKCRYLSEDRVT